MKIKKGNHYPNWMFPWIVKTNSFSRKFRFTDSCRYSLPDLPLSEQINGEGRKDWLDWNKLTGFTLGLKLSTKLVHENSVRIGWRYNSDTDKIELTDYVYNDGILSSGNSILSIDIGETVFINITRMVDFSYLVTLGKIYETVHRITAPFKEYKKYGWLCYSYFGGNRYTPHNIIIDKL